MRRLRIADLPSLRLAAGAGGRSGNRVIAGLFLLAALLLVGCTSSPPQKEATGTAYAGPANLNLRKDLSVKSAVVATAHHGDRLDVVETRRRFVRVRMSAGVEGWTDARDLLSEQQMSDLRDLATSVAKLPSEGEATVYAELNVHAEPYRTSPSFFQIAEGSSVEVIGHKISPHVPPPSAAKPLVKRSANTSKKAPAKKKAASTPPLIPPPSPPPPPKNWVELSRPHRSDLAAPSHAPPPAGAPAEADDWALVRTHQGETGWALSRMLVMKIPDEVAQYAEGHRITAYLSLGDVQDKEKNEQRSNWLWTTASANLQPYEFDSMRVFVWSTKRHHYETAFIEKNLKGHYPVQVESLPGQEEKAFSVVVEEKDGGLYKRTYAFTGYHVRMVSKTAVQPLAALPEVHSSGEFEPSVPPAPVSTSWTEKWEGWRKKLFGH
ncbi:MAG TPA: SH3 domain-containing protein [Bryobacteraceae bacterium]|jgi:SH3-like domain-containing protein